MSDVPPPPSGDPAPPSAPPVGGYSAPGGPVPAPSGGAGSGGILSATWGMDGSPAPAGWVPKQKIVAGILGILLGSWGIHNFYMGNSKKGIIQIVVTIVTCGIGGLWGFIEGIMILIGSQTTDAYGVPLSE